MDLISIIVGYRNRELTRIIRFLESLRNQTLKNFELIFIDYGSDEPLAIEIKQLIPKYEFASYYFNDTRGKEWNRSHALNTGVNFAKGEYLFFVDIDLIFHPGTIAHLYEIKSYSKHIYTRVHFIEETFNDYDAIFQKKDIKFELSHTSAKGIMFISKQVFLEIGGYDEYYCEYGSEDNDINLRLNKHGLQEEWINHELYPVYHQWHKSGSEYSNCPEKWIDNISFYYWNNSSNINRNKYKGKVLLTEERKLLQFIYNNREIKTILIPENGFVSTKSFVYRKIWWELLDQTQTSFFKIIVPKFKIPSMSLFQKTLAFCCNKLLILTKSPFTIQYFQKTERNKYFLPEEDIKWFFRKLVKETDLIADYYIQEEKDSIVYYVKKNN